MSQQEQDKRSRNSQNDPQRKQPNSEPAKAAASARELLIAQVSQEARDIDYERWDGMA